MSKYQNRDVTVIRPAQAGDPGFDASKGAQSLINDNGTQKAVLTSDVSA